MPTAGERIRQLRIRRGMTQVQLADAVGVSPQVISNIERSYTSDRTKADVLASMASALGTTVDYLIGAASHSVMAESETEENLVLAFRSLNSRRQTLVMELLQELCNDPGKEA